MLFILLGSPDSVIRAAENDIAGTEEQLSEGEKIREVDKFQYEIEGRPDPFLPFLSQESGRKDVPDDTPGEEGREKPLTGMQLFEPGQLKLVALLKLGSKNVAMVEDIAGKGYRLDENMLIGRYGTINRITNEQVEITEQYKTQTGRLITKEIIMRLKKEEDN
ncbi:MAG: hypothetical protein D3906_05865 [Candidatus Electrothrix sp. AUS1_2]|nr:hypothetical protein [Candidatus Electrothrix sp. AUS1_2]